MRYSGSKKRFSKYIVPVIMEHLNDGMCFYDLFGGGMNIISEVPFPNKVAVDYNRYVIMLWKELQLNGMTNIPKEVTKDEYNDIKKSYINNDRRYPDYIIGYVGNCCSYGGAWWNGYANYNPKKKENHILEAYNGLKKQVENFKYLKETKFIYGSYDDIDIDPDNSFIYCDPPYFETKKYETDFDNHKFWNWCVNFRKHILISEYSAPYGFECIWEMSKKDGMGTTKKGDKQKVKIEKLFM